VSAASLRSGAIERIAEALGYTEGASTRLNEALTHRSFTNELAPEAAPDFAHNERLEFLGDAVVGLVVAQALMERYPDAAEGQLSRWRAGIVNARSLAAFAKARGIGDALRLGRGEHQSGGRDKETLLADAYEAVVGAVYVDFGLEPARGLILEDAQPCVDAAHVAQATPDPKTALQELVYARWRRTPRYALIEATGPDHERTFHVELIVPVVVSPRGLARSKKRAEREAAIAALEVLSRAPSADGSAPSAAGSESPSPECLPEGS